MTNRLYAGAMLVVILLAACVAALASRRNSLTFDEPFMVASGVRALETGDISMTWDQPPVMFYVYGTAVYAYGAAAAATGQRGVRLPSEQGSITLPPELTAQLPRNIDRSKPLPRWGVYNRFDYAREFFFTHGNNPEALAFAARIAAILVAAGLATLVAAFAWRHDGPLAALFSTAIIAFLPDVLAHGAIAYNDVPLALCFFAALWATDHFVRAPTVLRAVLVGLLDGLALGVKFSAVALGPSAVALLVAELLTRRSDRRWMLQVARLTPLSLAIAWIVLAITYRGDFSLLMFRDGLLDKIGHAGTGHGVATLLLGKISENGFWYFFPLALLLKMPVALHVLAALAIYTLIRRGEPSSWVRSPLRILPIGAFVFLVILMQSSLNIGVRHALPLLPLTAVAIGIGAARLWFAKSARWRAVIAALIMVHVASSLSRYPWFLSYVTDIVPPSKRATAFVDSNTDWGQGLIALRDFMQKEQIGGVQLAYFGSALPEGYRVNYAPLPSWLPLPEAGPQAPGYDWVIVSATHLQGIYVQQDPYRELRTRTPDRVIAGSLYAYRLR
jgi:4-amino-4-deoxy-L-arabinose transferase-like glycosyltransferase